MAKKRNNRPDVVFDDDTSDTSTDDEAQIESFKRHFSTNHPKEEEVEASPTDSSDSNESEVESEDELKDASAPVSTQKLTDKVMKLRAHLDLLKNISGSDSDGSDSVSENEMSGDENELLPKDNDSSDYQSSDEKNVLSSKKNTKMEERDKHAKQKTNTKKNRITVEKIKTEEPAKTEHSGDVNERIAFRKELSKMTIEEIQKLKEKVGLKLFNEATGIKRPGFRNRPEFKRENKNRPREISSKRKVGRYRDVVGLKSGQAKQDKRDPRFDTLCGEFDQKDFRKRFEFVDELRAKEREQLKKELKTETDSERIKQIKYLIQRMENQDREKKKLAKEKIEIESERKKNLELIKEGKKPVYMTKSERKAKNLVEKFEELTQTGKLDHYLKRKQKKELSKEKKRIKLM